jgi:DNA phosphorothioation-associated putative methyltransferase
MEGLTLTGDRVSSAARTAISRNGLSRPVTQALQDGVIGPGRSLLDYGCGHGGDVTRLRKLGYSASGWDPAFAPDEPLEPADIVNLGYVVNVIESATERADTLHRAWALARSALVVAARLDWEARGPDSRAFKDGVITTRGTFQRFYTQYELKTWIESALGTTAHAAAPGVFYVFRNPMDAESLRVRQVRRPGTAPRRPVSQLLYEQHQELLSQIEAFLSERGRLPDASELADGETLLSAFGSVRRAFQVLCRATNRYDWSAETARARGTTSSSTSLYQRSAAAPGWEHCRPTCSATSRAFSALTARPARKPTRSSSPCGQTTNSPAPQPTSLPGRSCQTQCTSTTRSSPTCRPCSGYTPDAEESWLAPSRPT